MLSLSEGVPVLDTHSDLDGEGRKRGAALLMGLHDPNLMFPVSCRQEVQERVDTGTPLFCPVVVVSSGSSLNHSA